MHIALFTNENHSKKTEKIGRKQKNTLDIGGTVLTLGTKIASCDGLFLLLLSRGKTSHQLQAMHHRVLV
jgi:hypothetical protein